MAKSQHFLFGYHAVCACVTQRPRQVEQIWIAEERQDKRVQALIKLAREANIPIHFVDKPTLSKTVHSADTQGFAASCEEAPLYNESDLESLIASALETKVNKTNPLLFLVLDGITDPHNLGACIRTAEAAGVNALLVPKDNSAPLSPIVRKVACGAAETLPIVIVTNLSRALEKLKFLNVWIVGTDCEAKHSIYETDLSLPIALVLGNEEKGLRRLTKEHCDFLAAIPMQGSVASLNVSVATGICLFEVMRQRRAKR